MKFGIVVLTTLLTTIGLSLSVTAQLRNPSQDFFETGREELEREIQTLQGEPSKLEQNLQKPQSEPLLQVSPSPANESIQKQNEDETPSHEPNHIKKSR